MPTYRRELNTLFMHTKVVGCKKKPIYIYIYRPQNTDYVRASEWVSVDNGGPSHTLPADGRGSEMPKLSTPVRRCTSCG